MGDVPISGPAFEAMMREVDAELKAEGLDIPSRPLSAVGKVSIRHGDIPIPLGGVSADLPVELARHAPLADAIRNWYDEIYGDRVKVDMSAGRVVVLIDGDLYVLRIPRFFGSVNFVLEKQFLPKAASGRQRVICNVLQLIDDMTPALAFGLSDEAMGAIAKAFEIALHAAYTMENTQHEMMRIARNDVQVAVKNLMERQDHYGASKWASLQAAEKVLKAAILMKGGTFKFIHDLKKLCRGLVDLGVKFNYEDLITEIQCDPKIRYGEEACTREQAVAAHHAALTLVNRLREASVGFTLGLG